MGRRPGYVAQALCIREGGRQIHFRETRCSGIQAIFSILQQMATHDAQRRELIVCSKCGCRHIADDYELDGTDIAARAANPVKRNERQRSAPTVVNLTRAVAVTRLRSANTINGEAVVYSVGVVGCVDTGAEWASLATSAP